ncbi:MAG: N-6 DNA methylase, partial [Fimbriimonadaceae bacterium]|nr:N-6 DNA methylase [Fimbriimonadaceae bacterium]
IVSVSMRSDLGQHYTSVPNILKSIEPLFLDSLKEQFDAGYDHVKKLEALLKRIGAIKIFDPACGSGNFLVIAYKELRKLEHAILERLAELDPRHQVLFAESVINIENFYGIELDDFAVEVAILSLWIAKHQMNAEFKEKFSVSIPLIPLKETGRICAGNATRVDWNTVCPNRGEEIYLIGNPPYSGSSKQTAQQKEDYTFVFGDRQYSKKLNYIALWFIKGASYIEDTPAQLAFVTTKTVTQGEHVGLMFPTIFGKGVEIGFANTGFQWANNAKGNADVTVAVIGLRKASTAPKYLYTEDRRLNAKNINGYLADGDNVFVHARTTPLSSLPQMTYGSKPTDGRNLMLAPQEKARLLADNPAAEPFIKKALGSVEFINGEDRYCIWVEPGDAERAAAIPELDERFERCAAMRRASAKLATQKLADVSYRFEWVSYKPTESIIVPSVSSGLREYIPMGYLGPDTVITNLAFAIYDAEPWVFTLLMSKMHMVWVNAVAGRMRINYRYSNTIVYNNFPVPTLSDDAKESLTVAALRVLDVREYHCEKTLAELYAPDKMPTDLCAAHAEADALVDSIYSKRGYATDEQRLSDLFAMYEVLAAEQKAQHAKRSKK